MTIGLLLTAFALGLRHGVDWDHIAAISDLCGSTESRRRGFMLSLFYALGHGLVVLVLGAAAIVFSASIPESVDEWLGDFVGVTLVALGIWVIVGVLRHGSDFRLRSRWMLIIDGTMSGLRKVRGRRGDGVVVVESEHEHPHVHDAELDQLDQLHEHAHSKSEATEVARVSPVPVGAPRRRHRHGSPPQAHSHRHSHETEVRSTLEDRSGGATATGIGMLHGVGIESPTQIAVFVASTTIGGYGLGLTILAVWVVGLIVANGVLAVLAGSGLLHAQRNSAIYRTIAVIVGVGSIAVGLGYLFGFGIG
ncbi:MAG: ABC-type nickel/cobalt efflux system permease component RcnA [Verrucomicrobiales bacterium]|jgi:ABC-type nickel/cobalt efflux system permease component RcnA